MANYTLNEQQVAQYWEDGYLILPKFFSQEEMHRLLSIARADRVLMDDAYDRLDRSGRISRLSLRHDLEPSVYSAYARHRAIVEPMTQLIGGEIFHYHHKMMLKEPLIGGSWEWHQDYGYWYNNFLYADMASCMISVDRANRENGCLQVLRGSHKLGRIEHVSAGDQTGADLQRVEIALRHLQVDFCELEPGSLLFFHSNLLHRSDANESDQSRWALICCYSASNNPTIHTDSQHAQYYPLEMLDADQVCAAADQHIQELGN